MDKNDALEKFATFRGLVDAAGALSSSSRTWYPKTFSLINSGNWRAIKVASQPLDGYISTLARQSGWKPSHGGNWHFTMGSWTGKQLSANNSCLVPRCDRRTTWHVALYRSRGMLLRRRPTRLLPTAWRFHFERDDLDNSTTHHSPTNTHHHRFTITSQHTTCATRIHATRANFPVTLHKHCVTS